jgi:hypothetical protein
MCHGEGVELASWPTISLFPRLVCVTADMYWRRGAKRKVEGSQLADEETLSYLLRMLQIYQLPNDRTRHLEKLSSGTNGRGVRELSWGNGRRRCYAKLLVTPSCRRIMRGREAQQQLEGELLDGCQLVRPSFSKKLCWCARKPLADYKK